MRIANPHLIILGVLSTLPLQALTAPCGSEVNCSENSLLNLVPRIAHAVPGLDSFVGVVRRANPRKTTKAGAKSTAKGPAATSSRRPNNPAASSARRTQTPANSPPAKTTSGASRGASSTRSTAAATHAASSRSSSTISRTRSSSTGRSPSGTTSTGSRSRISSSHSSASASGTASTSSGHSSSDTSSASSVSHTTSSDSSEVASVTTSLSTGDSEPSTSTDAPTTTSDPDAAATTEEAATQTSSDSDAVSTTDAPTATSDSEAVSSTEEAVTKTTSDGDATATSKESNAPEATESSSSSHVCKRAGEDPAKECAIPENSLLDDLARDGTAAQLLFEKESAEPDKATRPVTDNYDLKQGDAELPEESHEVDFYDDYPQIRGGSDKPWEKYKVFNKPGEGYTEPPQPILAALTRPETGSIVILESYNRERDGLRRIKDDPKIMPWSDMLLNIWKKACNDKQKNIHDLKYLVRKNVGEETKLYDALELIAAAQGKKMEDGVVKGGESVKISREDSDMAYFYSLEGTEHGKRVDRMLGQHHTALEEPRIKLFHAYKASFHDLWDMVIELER